MSHRPRVVVAGLFHETHTFLRHSTSQEQFSSVPLVADGPAQVAGALQVATECSWEVVPGPYWLATPSGLVEDNVVEAWWDALAPLLPDADGVYLDLHGAMVSTSFLDVEGELLERVRRATAAPIAVALDLHGNSTDRMCQPGIAFTAYRENPHTDVQATARRAATLLQRLLTTGERLQAVRLQPPLVFPPSGTATAAEPMRTLEAQARAAEAALPELLDCSVFAGFSFADIPETGVSFLATVTEHTAAVDSVLAALAATALDNRESALLPAVPLAELRLPDKPPGAGPVLLVEPSDNVGGGAPGDATHLLRWLLENQVENAAVCLWDPVSVAALWDQPEGAVQTIALGAHSGEWGVGEPVIATLSKRCQSDGTYRLADPHSHNAMYGAVQQLGRTVVAQADGVTLLLTSLPTPPMDLGPWLSVGLDPRAFAVMTVKAAVAHRHAYEPIASGSIRVDVPGPCAENLARLPYRRLRRPVWPQEK